MEWPEPARMIVIYDSRECPGCLKERIKEADALLLSVYMDGSKLTHDAIRRWADYVCKYNP